MAYTTAEVRAAAVGATSEDALEVGVGVGVATTSSVALLPDEDDAAVALALLLLLLLPVLPLSDDEGARVGSGSTANSLLAESSADTSTLADDEPEPESAVAANDASDSSWASMAAWMSLSCSADASRRWISAAISSVVSLAVAVESRPQAAAARNARRSTCIVSLAVNDGACSLLEREESDVRTELLCFSNSTSTSTTSNLHDETRWSGLSTVGSTMAQSQGASSDRIGWKEAQKEQNKVVIGWKGKRPSRRCAVCQKRARSKKKHLS